MSAVARIAYVAFFLCAIGVVGVPGAVLFGWLVSGAQAGVLQPFHAVALPVAIGSLFFGSVIRDLSSIAEAGASLGASLVLIAASLSSWRCPSPGPECGSCSPRSCCSGSDGHGWGAGPALKAAPGQ